MSISYKRISSLGTSHDPSQYMPVGRELRHETLDFDQDRFKPILSTSTVIDEHENNC